jgi:hypothetical protein
MTVTIYYKDAKSPIDTRQCDLWGIDTNNSLLRLYKGEKQRCNFFVRLTEIRKVEIDYEESRTET